MSAGTGIVGQQVLQRRHHLLQPVLPSELQDVGNIVQVPGTVVIRPDAQGRGAAPGIRQAGGELGLNTRSVDRSYLARSP
ncbi:hypothetical protein [Arthrobacter sp. HMWF013]|uniref:hypothetical protein n=1 Tax=Arthrobacter sp. HMWF013 TaxID=2056849 RepID=UPI002159C8E8|nr:hypothetical protein [Arthrobacter sp. HMWF013]